MLWVRPVQQVEIDGWLGPDKDNAGIFHEGDLGQSKESNE
jgi:hypothetical protein